jgi:A/G-specific adenine glycosylase
MGIKSSKQATNEVSVYSNHRIGKLRSAVLTWFAVNGRDFPWRRTLDPFRILVAEFLLRQTQATRLAGPYVELTTRYPSASSLSVANIDELREWFKPLGLVKRGDYLVQTSRILVADHGGKVPKDLKALLGLPGLGRYGARAVLCLAFGAPLPMVDEGSGRVLRRIQGMIPKGPAYCDSALLRVAETILPKGSPREFNLGLIDIAATFCRPNMPRCTDCPISDACLAVCWVKDTGIRKDTKWRILEN